MRKRLMNVAVKSGVYTIPEQIQYRSRWKHSWGNTRNIRISRSADHQGWFRSGVEHQSNPFHAIAHLWIFGASQVGMKLSARRRCSSCENESPRLSRVVVESQQKCVLRSSSSPSPHWCRLSFEESVIAFNLRSRMLIISILSGWEYASARRDS